MASIKNHPAFETEDAASNEAKAAVQAGVTTDNGTTVATRANTAVAAPAKFAVAFSEFNGFFDIATVEGLALATPRIKGEQGSLFKGDVDLGSSILFEIVSFNPRWVVGCGTDDEEAKELFRVSYDNVVTTQGENVVEYIANLKAQGYDKAGVAPYLDIFGFVVRTATGEIPIENREIACLQCSKTSMGAFQAFATTQGLLQSRGIAKAISIVQVDAMKRTAGTNKYTNFAFSVPKAG